MSDYDYVDIMNRAMVDLGPDSDLMDFQSYLVDEEGKAIKYKTHGFLGIGKGSFNRKQAASIISASIAAQEATKQAVLEHNALIASSAMEAQSAKEVAQINADAQIEVAEKELEAVKLQTEVDRDAIESEEKIEMERLKNELWKYQNIDYGNMLANQKAADAAYQEALGNYEYDKARGEAKLASVEDGSSGSYYYGYA